MTNPSEFQLEKYKGKNSRFTCPKCNNNKQFTRYIHPVTSERLPSHVGICNRKDKCGYAFTNWDLIRESPSFFEKSISNIKPLPILPPSFMDIRLLRKSMSHYSENNLYLFLCKLLGEGQADKTFATYHVGTSKHWKGASIYWQIDISNHVRSGKIMLYNSATGKREHKKQTWVHSVMNTQDFNLSQCLFGEHLLALDKNRNKSIAIVESEKTAIIASSFVDKVVWLATGGLDLLNPATNPSRFKHLVGKNVILFPDLSLPTHLTAILPLKTGQEKQIF